MNLAEETPITPELEDGNYLPSIDANIRTYLVSVSNNVRTIKNIALFLFWLSIAALVISFIDFVNK